ncbi:hypothetical protein DRW03_18435 [Corallococcus sp. H22C18031201]|nr:hypothetical protein DRW03_18435 [Corallococcus sp. H22C18031201]
MSSTLESYELIRFAEAFEARLVTAEEMLAGRSGLDEEKQWLATALDRLRVARQPAPAMLARVKDLPELEEAREEYTFDQQGRWVDTLEKLHAGITFTASSRAPVIEALFPHLKFPQLRRAPREAVTEFATSYERRMKSAYVTRIFAREDFALVRPVVEQVVVAHGAWLASLTPTPIGEAQEAELREDLVSLGRRLEQVLRQGRLLAEAALVPVPGLFEAAGLTLKPRKRAGRGLALTSDEGMAEFLEGEPDADTEGSILSEEGDALATETPPSSDETGPSEPPTATSEALASEEPEAAALGAPPQESAASEVIPSPDASDAVAASAEPAPPARRGRPKKVAASEEMPAPSPEPTSEAEAPRRGRRKKAGSTTPETEAP